MKKIKREIGNYFFEFDFIEKSSYGNFQFINMDTMESSVATNIVVKNPEILLMGLKRNMPEEININNIRFSYYAETGWSVVIKDIVGKQKDYLLNINKEDLLDLLCEIYSEISKSSQRELVM